MTSCIPCINIKHATLINNCYPPIKEETIIPRSSELSYLTFYATSKPAKLTKVGSFIQKKVERDIRKNRKSHILISLNIIKTLIQSCQRDLNIFSKNIINILTILLNTNDLDIIELCCETFVVFCSFHDGSTLGVDLNFTFEYENLLEKFSKFCSPSTKDLKIQYIGHRAIQAAVSSNALQSSNFKTQINLLFPPLIKTLALSKNSEIIEISQIDSSSNESQSIESIASNTISLLFNNLTGPSIRLSFVPLFEYLDKNQAWYHSQLIVNIFKLALNSIQSQYRYLLVSDILHQLDTLENNIVNDKYTTLILVLDSILNAKISLVGISVLEVLNSVFNHLIKLIQRHSWIELSSPNDEKTVYQIYKTQHALVDSVGGLASHIYYDNQLNDMMGYLISKLRSNTLLESIDDIMIYDYREIVLHCLDNLVNTTNSNLISLVSWNSALDLLHDNNPKTRIIFAQSFYRFLQTIKTNINTTTSFPEHTLTHHQDLVFMDRLVHSFHDWILTSDLNLTDLKFFYSILCLINRKFGIDATVMIIPLIFDIQRLIEEDKITLKSRQMSIEYALMNWFITTAHLYQIPGLDHYIQSIKQPIQLNLNEMLDEIILKNHTIESFDIQLSDIDYKQTKIERSKVVEFMSKEGKLRDESDTHGLELEAKLFVEWGYESVLRNDQIQRLKILQDVNEIKPRLASPWSFERLPITLEDKRESIRVSNLKEALTGQSATDDEDAETNSSQSNSLPLTIKPIPMKQNDMNALLVELNLSHHDTSTVSLVNPPYKST